jgi:hypothetical protein
MPVRFTSPSLGGQRQSFLGEGEWQVGVAYRHLGADKWFVGSEVKESAAPYGQPLYLSINSLDFSVTYGVTDRFGLTLTLPFSHGTQSRLHADSARHKVRGLGLGDISLVGSAWLFEFATHPKGNISVGLGIKAPTGNNEVTDDFFLVDGSVARGVVDQSVQLGDGGWGILLQAQAFRRVGERANAYLLGSYLLSPRVTTSVPSPIKGVPLSVPDVYSARAGLSFALWPSQGISVSLGGRLDGIPLRDIIGGGDMGFRRPGFTLFLDPGMVIGRGRDELNLSVPIRLHQDFRRGLIDREVNFPGGGDLADMLIFAGYTHRF